MRSRRAGAMALASNKRLMTVHEDDSLLDARLSTLVRHFLPSQQFQGTRDYHAFDVVITGGNPVLAVVLLAKACAAGMDAAVTLGGKNDDWPYDLFLSEAMRSFVDAILGCDARQVIPRYIAMSRGACLLPATALSLSDKQHHGELTLYPDMSEELVGDDADPSFTEIKESFVSVSSALPRAEVRPRAGTAVFAKRLVLTSVPEHFCASKVEKAVHGDVINWDIPRVRAVGAAGLRAASGKDAATAMINDLFLCAKGEVLWAR